MIVVNILSYNYFSSYELTIFVKANFLHVIIQIIFLNYNSEEE